jgi:glycosyltransferase involved in cell wall biosynthesis
MRENKYFLVHVHTPMASFLGRLAAKLTNTKPVLHTAHGFHFYKGAPWYYWAFIYPAEYLIARWTDGLIVMNQEDYINAQRMGFKPNKNLFLVHGVGVDLKKYKNNIPFPNNGIKDELGLKERDLVISCVAEFIPRKNHIFLLKSWEKITKKFNNIHLLFIGKGKCLNNLKEYVKQNLIPRVYFLGYRNDVPKILLKSDIVVLVSKHEGLPRSIMEGIALGKPVIVSNVRGNRDLVEQGNNGLLVDLGDIDGLISSMKKLITNDKLRDDMGKASLEKIKEYDIEKVLAEMSSIYDYYLEK